MRRLTAVLWLEAVALLLAAGQSLIGVRTDEAKYLLNIPYPHPPLLRFVMGLTDGIPYQDILWRVIFASALVQAVWLVRDIARGLHEGHRAALLAAWLCSTALLLQAGTVMLVVPTALFGLVFLWLIVCRERMTYPGLIGLLWIGAAFTALQSVLFAPLVWEALRRRSIHPLERIVVVLLPIFLLLLYIATNPFALASIAGLGGDAVHADWNVRLQSFMWIWLIGGSAIVSIAGTAGMLRFPQWPVLLSFGIVCAYALVSHGHMYYALLLLPFFIAGMHAAYAAHASYMPGTAVVVSLSLLFTIFAVRLQPIASARTAAVLLSARGGINRVMISGPFGHEWQYELQADVRRFTTGLLPVTDAIICTANCPAMHSWDEEWEKISDDPQVWVRRR